MSNAMVTGPSSGIGRAVALALAKKGFHVVAAGRSAEKVGRVVDEIRSSRGTAETLVLDLASFQSTKTAAREFEESGRSLDVLVNNAGVAVARGTTVDGFQVQFGVNHLGHFLLTHHLRRTFRPGTRVIQVSSDMHHRARGIDFEAVTKPTRSMFGVAEYAASKLANVLFVREMARRQPDWGIYAVHPGLVDTPLFPALTRPLVRMSGVTPEQGADTVVWCAMTEDGLTSGGYYASRTEKAPSAVARDDDLAAELWRRSERWCGVGPVN
jgi:NAD(P)-dependent dehydrogenase (short-subunit alcohol dehydrogenase family)